MRDPSADEALYQDKLRLARLALAWERLWALLAPPLSVAALLLSIALLDLLPALPGWLHVMVLGAGVVALSWAAVTAVRGWRPIVHGEARHRLEVESGLAHRPLAALEDRPLTAPGQTLDAATGALWRAYMERARAVLAGLRVGWPRPGLAARDPRALRALALLMLVVGVAAGWHDPMARLGRALTPSLAEAGPPVTFDLWITPPAYTGHAALHRRIGGEVAANAAPAASAKALTVPTGSKVLVQSAGTREAPVLTLGADKKPFDAIGGQAGGHRLEMVINQGGRLALVHDGAEVAGWDMSIIPDAAPVAEVLQKPAKTLRGHLQIDYAASDDYGLAALRADIARVGAKDGETIGVDISLTQPGRQKKVKGRHFRDLTAHPWAGHEATIRIIAEDAAGQTGTSEAVTFLMPERIFNHPVARAIVEQRKKLVDPTPEVLADVDLGLARIQAQPQLFKNHSAVFLSLSVSRARLAHGREAGSVPSVQQILWDTAVWLEDGNFAVAERELQELLDRLMAEMKQRDFNDKNLDAVERMMDAMQRAMNEFMRELAERSPQMGAEQIPFDPETMEMMSSDDMRRLIEEARRLARQGNLDAARQRLAELQRMMQAMRNGMMARPDMKRMEQARRRMNQLRDIARRQQQLLDRSFQAQNQRRQRDQRDSGQEKPGREKGDPTDQRQLRGKLGDLMMGLNELLGGIPKGLGQAERAMRGAERLLEHGQPGDAIGPQTQALEKLRGAMNSVGEQMARQMGAMPGGMPTLGRGPGMGPGMAGQRPGQRRGRDPFGRQYGTGGNIETGQEMLGPVGPDDSQRAREVLEELRRRGAERSRPKPELDYIDRLLKRF